MKKSAFTPLLLGLQATASVALCVLCYLWVQKSREFNRLNLALRVITPTVTQNKSALTQMVTDAAVYSEKNPAMRTLLLQMGVKIENQAPAAATPPQRSNR